MENLPLGQVSPDDYRRHVVIAKTFEGSDAEYCRQHGLLQHSFSYHKSSMKKKLKKKKSTSSGFAKVQPVIEAAKKPKSIVTTSTYIDPAWLASFLSELLKK